jgi:predicted peptidase
MKINRLLLIVSVILFTMGMYVCSTMAATHPMDQNAAPAVIKDAKGHILGVAPITEIFGDGWKITAVAVEYDKIIKSSTLGASDYKVITGVEGQKITKVYTNSKAQKTTQGLEGRYVILELSHDYTADTAKALETGKIQAVVPKGNGVAPDPIKKVGNISWDPSAHPATLLAQNQGGNGKDVYVYQVGDIDTVSGDRYTAFENQEEAVANYWCLNPILDDFLKPDYNDSASGRMKYNIYFPKDFDETKSCPAVVFIANGEASGGRHADVLTNGGLGAVIWADPAEQAKKECIVILPAFRGAIVDKSYESVQEIRNGTASNSYLAILDMMDYLMKQVPNIDKARVYLTGQGSGARAAIKMMIDRPDMFAASLLFAPDYDRSKISKLSKANMWIVVSEGDDAIYTNMEGCVDSLKAAGARISKAVWNGQASAAQFATNVGRMVAECNNIKYTVLKKGTVVPSGIPDDTVNNHAYTWRTGYSIKGLRDWLFMQEK